MNIKLFVQLTEHYSCQTAYHATLKLNHNKLKIFSLRDKSAFLKIRSASASKSMSIEVFDIHIAAFGQSAG